MILRLLPLLLLLGPASALDNGVARTPAMGYSSWNDCASAVTERRIKNVTRQLIDKGLAAKGFVHVNIDEGWLKARDATSGALVEDLDKFPSGMKALGDWIHEQVVPGRGKIMKYGLYTCRGTCQCATKQYQGPGGHGHEAQDARWLADAGADYLKVDSCCGDQDHGVAFSDYGKWRDGLNATGRPVVFSLCGWHTWYAPQGNALGNSWRIAGDGTNWGALSNCINLNAQLQQYASHGAWNDPDLLQGTGVGSNDKATNPQGCYDKANYPQAADWYQTEAQSRAQFSMWCVMSAPLLISADVGQVSAYSLATWGNEELIAVNQQFREDGPYQGARLVGGDLSYGKVEGGGYTGSGANVWGKLLPGGDFALVFVSNEDAPRDLTCNATCFDMLLSSSSRAGGGGGAVLASQYTVRDLWQHADVGVVSAPFTLTAKQLAAHGGVAAFRLSPKQDEAFVL
jgi:alpha-galactosidase